MPTTVAVPCVNRHLFEPAALSPPSPRGTAGDRRDGEKVSAARGVVVAIIGLGMLLAGGGCHRVLVDTSVVTSYASPPETQSESELKAQTLNERGIKAFRQGKLDHAEEKFRQALAADVAFGPAHNNLGQIYLSRHQLYLAIWEFQYARQMMPGLVEPIINQGLAYETAEMLDRAEAFYREAVERDPTHPSAISALARLRIKMGADPYEIAHLLDQVILHDPRPQWIQWAKMWRVTQYASGCGVCDEGNGQGVDGMASSEQGRGELDATVNLPIGDGCESCQAGSIIYENADAPLPSFLRDEVGNGALINPPELIPTPTADDPNGLPMPVPSATSGFEGGSDNLPIVDDLDDFSVLSDPVGDDGMVARYDLRQSMGSNSSADKTQARTIDLDESSLFERLLQNGDAPAGSFAPVPSHQSFGESVEHQKTP